MEQSTRKLQSEAASPLAASADAGSALYVINLCASMTPIAHADKAIPGFENYRAYQVSRKEDGRVRYRLRLGFFTDREEAETALALIRDHYPTAFATSLSDDDQRHSRGFGGSSAPVAKSAESKAAPPIVKHAEAKPAASPSASSAATPKPTASATPNKAAAAPATKAIVSQSATAVASASTSDTQRVPAIKAGNIQQKPSGAPAVPAAKAPSTSASDTQRTPALKVDAAMEIELEWDAPAAAQPPVPVAPVASVAAKLAPAAPAAATSGRAPIPESKSAVATAPVATAAPPASKIEKTTAAASKSAAPERKVAAETKLELSLEAEPAAPSQKGTTPSAEPFHVGKGVEIPTSALSLMLEPAALATAVAPTAPPPATAASQAKAAQPATPASPAAPAKPAHAKAPPAVKRAPAKPATPGLPKAPPVANQDEPLPDFDSTQTIRALTPEELDDENLPKWFAVQLAVSDQPINLDTMPHLDIFAAYRLYSVATAGSGKILHHMRIGFFKEQVSADAVAGYLKTFFANPSVLRISQAEFKRFSEAPPRIAVPETKAKVIDIAAARDRAPPKEIPVVTMEVVNPSTTGRFKKPNIEASGLHKQPSAAKPATQAHAAAAKSAARTKSGAMSTGKHKTLEQALLAEAREVELSESAIRRLPKNSSLLSKLFGKK